MPSEQPESAGGWEADCQYDSVSLGVVIVLSKTIETVGGHILSRNVALRKQAFDYPVSTALLYSSDLPSEFHTR
jgi:hypothetical protein